MKVKNPHFHLDVLASARLQIKVHTQARNEKTTIYSWLRSKGILCSASKIYEPSSWRISYGTFRRFAEALCMNTDALYRELTE